MSFHKIRTAAAIAAICLTASLSIHAQDKDKAADKPAVAAPEKSDKSDKDKAPPPLPPDAHVQQSIELNGKTLHYTATVGTLPTRDKDGKEAGEVVFTAYTVEGPNRPVTFAFNGGPGASSVYLNFGAIGPKHLEGVGNEGDSPSDPATLVDNPGTWLDFTDLVFIDPIGTGFSRASRPRSRGQEALLQHRTQTSNTSRASSTTGWSKTTASAPASISSAKATAASAARASRTTCRRSLASP